VIPSHVALQQREIPPASKDSHPRRALLVTQRHHGIDAGCAAGGEDCCQRRDNENGAADRRKSCGIGRRDLEQQRLQDAAQGQRASKTQADGNSGEDERFLKNQADDVT
jgi:hypothetical protein